MSRPRYWACVLLPGLFLTAAAARPPSARAADTLDDELTAVADEFARVVKGLGENAITVGTFTPPRDSAFSGGPGIANTLTDKLTSLDLKVEPGARFTLQGDYSLGKDPDTGAISARIHFVLVNKAGKPLREKLYNVKGAKVFCSLYGVIADIPPGTPKVDAERLLGRLAAHPSPVFKASRVTASKTCPYDVEILVKDGDAYKTRAIRDDDSMALVKINRDEIYAVKVHNNSDYDAAVSLYVDGLNIFEFSSQRDYSYYILPAHSAGVIYGWHRDNKNTNLFQVMKYADSAVAARLFNPTAEVETITACFSAAWAPDQPPPRDENAAILAQRGGANATGLGPLIKKDFQEVRRQHGVVRASISVRYEKSE
jgi:hypothetical protein